MTVQGYEYFLFGCRGDSRACIGKLLTNDFEPAIRIAEKKIRDERLYGTFDSFMIEERVAVWNFSSHELKVKVEVANGKSKAQTSLALEECP